MHLAYSTSLFFIYIFLRLPISLLIPLSFPSFPFLFFFFSSFELTSLMNKDPSSISCKSPLEDLATTDSNSSNDVLSSEEIRSERSSIEYSAQELQQDTANQPLTAERLAEQNELYSNKLEPKPNAIRAWAADLPEVPDSVQPILTETHIFEMETLTLDDEEETEHHPRIQETKDVFTETQKIAYVSLCYLTSLEVVHDFQGKDFTYARMSADNWQRKLMRMLYVHMDISADGINIVFFFFIKKKKKKKKKKNYV
jgi:hypothetical protein